MRGSSCTTGWQGLAVGGMYSAGKASHQKDATWSLPMQASNINVQVQQQAPAQPPLPLHLLAREPRTFSTSPTCSPALSECAWSKHTGCSTDGVTSWESECDLPAACSTPPGLTDDPLETLASYGSEFEDVGPPPNHYPHVLPYEGSGRIVHNGALSEATLLAQSIQKLLISSAGRSNAPNHGTDLRFAGPCNEISRPYHDADTNSSPPTLPRDSVLRGPGLVTESVFGGLCGATNYPPQNCMGNMAPFRGSDHGFHQHQGVPAHMGNCATKQTMGVAGVQRPTLEAYGEIYGHEGQPRMRSSNINNYPVANHQSQNHMMGQHQNHNMSRICGGGARGDYGYAAGNVVGNTNAGLYSRGAPAPVGLVLSKPHGNGVADAAARKTKGSNVQAEKRRAADGHGYSKEEFLKHFGYDEGFDEWEHAFPHEGVPGFGADIDSIVNVDLSQDGPLPPNLTTLLVRRLPQQCSKQDLVRLWVPKGNIDFLHVPYSSKQRRSCRYGFVNFTSAEAAKEFYLRWHGTYVPLLGSDKILPLSISPAILQGLEANVKFHQGIGSHTKAHRPAVFNRGSSADLGKGAQQQQQQQQQQQHESQCRGPYIA